MNPRIFAIDWSGRRDDAEKSIWLAEVNSATKGVVQLRDGFDRKGIERYLIAESERDPNIIVGLDFAFSFPAWFVKDQGVQNTEQFWKIVEVYGETWLKDDERFWGKAGKRKTLTDDALMRATERATPRVSGIAPKSVFQIGGAGAVGTGSIRGMPMLHRLRTAGFSIWPFHKCGFPMAVEIYPRLLTGPINKSEEANRAPKVRRPFDSSKTRVAPVFNALSTCNADDPQWIRRLLSLSADGSPKTHPWIAQDLSIVEKFWAPKEEGCIHRLRFSPG